MKTLIAGCCLVILAQAGYAQGIAFKDVSFTEAKALATSEKKLIFIDCYTEWCGPCKEMEKRVYVQDSVGQFYNKNFINIKLDMEKDQGLLVKKQYEVRSFPTYLFLNPKGELVHRANSFMEADMFMKQARLALSPEASLMAVKKRYENGDRSTEVLFHYAMGVRRNNRELSEKIAAELAAVIKDEELRGASGWEIISALAVRDNDRFGKYFLAHKADYIAVAGKDKVEKKELGIMNATLFSLIDAKNTDAFWKKINFYTNHNRSEIQKMAGHFECMLYLQLGDTERFVQRYKQASTEQSDTDITYLTGKVLDKVDDGIKVDKRIFDALTPVMQDVTERQKGYYYVHPVLAKCYMFAGNKADALKVIDSALTLASNDKMKQSATVLKSRIEQYVAAF